MTRLSATSESATSANPAVASHQLIILATSELRHDDGSATIVEERQIIAPAHRTVAVTQNAKAA